MNRSEETEELINLIKQGAVVEKEPVYIQTAASHGERDYGDTYVEINLSKQHLYFWEKGNIIIESDFVSGNMVKGMATPGGIFPITYKERNAVLKGTNYRTPVLIGCLLMGELVCMMLLGENSLVVRSMKQMVHMVVSTFLWM